jgi:hypothetical protein
MPAMYRSYRHLASLPLARCFFSLLLITANFPALASAEQTFTASLSRDERLLLEQLVCGQTYGVALAEIDARAFDAKGGKPSYADVKCRPHASLKDQPLYYVAQCARSGKLWSCGQTELETLVKLPARELAIRPGTLEPKLAYEAIQKISGYGYFQGMSLDAALQSTCNMGMGDKPDLIEISCKRWAITVSFWCPKTAQKTACPRVIFMGERP